MSVEPSAASFASSAPINEVALVWRGACIEIYARVEHEIAECLTLLSGLGWQIHRDAHSPQATARMKALVKAIGFNAPDGHGPHAIKILEEWICRQKDRAWIAHARCFRIGGELVFDHQAWAGDKRILETVSITVTEAIERVEQLGAAHRQLRQALGQLKSQARREPAKAKAQT